MSFDYDSFYKELEKKKKEEEQKKQEQAAKKAAATTTPKTDAASESTEVTKTEDFYNSFFDELEKKQAMSPEELKKQADERDKEMLRANAEKMGAEKKGRTWFKKSETENNKSQYVDTGVWLNYTSGLSKEIRNGIYASNKKRIEEIDKQIASTFAGQESFWGALNPFDGGNPFNDSLKWGRSNNANKILREERDMLVGANAHYDKYGDAIDLSYEELKKKQEIAKQSGDTEAEMLYLSFANQKVYERISQELSKISYGKGATMLDKMAEIASMEDGKEKKKQIKEFEKALADKGYDFDKIYSNITGDYNMSADAFFNWLWASTNKGVAEFSSGVANTADTLLGNDFVKWLLGEENPISLATSQMREQTNKELAYLTFNQNLYKAQAGGGKGMEIAGNVISGAVAAVPDAIMAYWTGGLSTLNAPSKAVQNASYQLGNTFTKAGITATNMANNPLYWTSFIREYGSNYEEAKSKGASDLTAYFGATITSLVNAGIEIGLDGTSGIQGLTHDILDGNKSKLLSWIESSLEEGGEEMLQSFVSNATTKLLYDSDQELIQPKEMLEEGLTGAAVGGALGGGQIMLQGGVNQYNRVQNHIAERRLTESEQTVVDKTTEKRIAEKESKGVKLTEKLKKDVREQVFQQMKNGDLSVEEIEEALGGKAYTNYTQAVEGRNALDAEYESLLKKKEGDFTRGDTLRFEELTKAKNYDVVGKAREALDKTLGGVKGTRLEESYRERARRGEDFAFDASSVDSKLRDTYKRAAESGILNNTRKTHQLVDFIARISSDKGVSFDFTNNEKLKASGFAVEGRTVNGYVTSDGKTIGINVQSPKALNSVVGHEITHILEGTELYDSFAKLMEEYANTKGEYSSRFEAAKKLYEGKKGYEENLEVKVKKEVIADLAGDYLFTDSKFVEHLLNTDRNVFQRIWDEVKYLYKMATAGTPEAKKLEQVKHTFEKVYRQKGQKNTTREGGGVRYAISTDINGDQFVDVENTIISETDTAKDIADILSDIVENKYGEFVNVSSQKIGINKTTAREWQKSKNAQYLLNTDIGTYTDKMNAFSNADELLTVSKNYIGEKVKHIRKDNFVEFARGEINFKVGQNGYSADIIVGTTKSGVAVLYDIVNLQNKKIEVASNATQNRRTETPSAYSISENGENVKRKAAQFEIILQNNPATDSYHTWIRSARDIKTFEETLSDEDWSDGSDFDPDYTWDMAQKALTSGEITVYSSYPIEAGVFVTPSAMEARSYSGDGRIYSKTVKLTDVAWIDPTQGMFAQVKEGARYSLSEQFYNEYDDWDKTNPRKVFTIGNTSEVLKSLGVKDSEIKWDASKIIKIKANHPEMTDGIIKQVPDIIENPIVVFKSLQNESRLTLFGEVYANGKPILAVLELDPTGRNGASLDEIKIASAYGKDNAQNFINRSEALYIDSNRKRISDWEKRTGLQLPVGLPITDSIDSISENSGNVNSKLSLSDSDIAPTKYDDVRYSLTGKNIDGIEVYETSQDIMNLTWNERKAKYLDMMKNEYRGRTAKFVRNGHTYYATFDSGSIRKPIYGDSRSSTDGIKALIKAGADGNVFELVENSEYTGSKANTKNHTDADYFDYFVKTVQIDGKVFDLIADVEKKYGQNGGFVYTLALKENNKIKASPAHSSKTEPVKSAGNASAYSISENSGNVNSKLSLSDSDIAPTKYGDYNVYGEEVAKPEASEDIAPIRQDIAPAKKRAEQIGFDDAVSVMEYIAAAGESNSFKNRLKNWDGKTTGFSFVIGRPSKALQNAGIPNKQIRMDASKIKTILAQHEAMDIDTISQIPDLLNNPVVVIDSKQNENARIVMGDLHDKNGKTVTAVLLLTPTSRNGNVLNVIKVSSAQGRGHIASLFKNDDGSSVNVRYTDKKRIQAWLNANRLQLPLHNLSLDSEAESHIGISANESIPQFAPTVNNGTAVSGDIAPVSEDTDIVTGSEALQDIDSEPDFDMIDRYFDEGTLGDGTANTNTKEAQEKKKSRALSHIMSLLVDKGHVFETIDLKNKDVKDRTLQSGYQWMITSESRAQNYIEKGKDGVKPLRDLYWEVEKSGKAQAFNDYIYHLLNIDRMSIKGKALNEATALRNYSELAPLTDEQIAEWAEKKADEKTTKEAARLIATAKKYMELVETENKPVFGFDVTAETSKAISDKLLADNPEFAEWTKAVYDINKQLTDMAIEHGLLTRETTDLWAQMYPHYVPIHRVNSSEAATVNKKGKKAGVNSPFKRADGGTSDIESVFTALASRISQVYKATARNDFGIDLEKSIRAGEAKEDLSQVNPQLHKSLSTINDRSSKSSIQQNPQAVNEEINTYIEKAGSNSNSNDHLNYAKPSERLMGDVNAEVDISEYVHTLRDNDIRHIYNSHGIKTNEKYPITAEDIKMIPSIVQDYDKVFVVKRQGKDGRSDRVGIIYVKVNKDNTVYYLEQVTDKYHNEKLLVNKQMIKVGLNDIPKLKGLEDAIIKKQSKDEYLADLNEAHKVYAQGATQSYSDNIISQNPQAVNDESSAEEKSAGYDEIMDNLDNKDFSVQEGGKGIAPTMTVFKNGKRVTFDITEDMYDALRTSSDLTDKLREISDGALFKGIQAFSKFQKAFLTEYNIRFSVTNPIKDLQDVVLNSQHAGKTYLAMGPSALAVSSNGSFGDSKTKAYYQEYIENGGRSNTYFDRKSKSFGKKWSDKSKLERTGAVFLSPLTAISTINQTIEMMPRFAEYMASRELGRDIKTSMLDAARVTTNFQAGGDVTKFLNKNGANFLNASVQGTAQLTRNVREAIARDGAVKGMLKLVVKSALYGIPAVVLNYLIWEKYLDDDDYKELSDYIKDNFYGLS